MRHCYDEKIVASVAAATGLEGDDLDFLTGVVVATATMGKIPVKNDLALFLGMSRTEMEKTGQICIQKAWEQGTLRQWADNCFEETILPKPNSVYIALAATVIASGEFRDWGGDKEPVERALARRFLSSRMFVQRVNCKALLCGYLATIEFLWFMGRTGDDADINQFVAYRYGGRNHIKKDMSVYLQNIVPGEKLSVQIENLLREYQEFREEGNE